MTQPNETTVQPNKQTPAQQPNLPKKEGDQPKKDDKPGYQNPKQATVPFASSKTGS